MYAIGEGLERTEATVCQCKCEPEPYFSRARKKAGKNTHARSCDQRAMVFFTCNACGSSLKKNQVEKHYQYECPRCEVLSCIDCGKDFHGDEYAAHTKCISEAEKYRGNLFKDSGKAGRAGKGEKKQQEWLEVHYNLRELNCISC